ncbi:MAG: signal peptide peptidase SppA [Proteobacteria bacterium]|nr:signal peptide peptidase SppA [Pseudomonadota bacterium]
MSAIRNGLTYMGGLFVLMIFFWVSFLIFAVYSIMQVSGSEMNLANLQIKTDHAVGVVEATGEIMNSDKFIKNLKDNIDNEKIKAIVIKIDSPGGAVGASEEMYRAVKEASAKKPVVCSMGNIAASGGLMTAAGCKKIVANESTLTGSIGVIMMSPNLSTIMEKVGFSMNVVKSGKLKDAGSPFKAVSEDDKAYLQGLVNKSYEQFVRIISESRNIPIEKVKSFADGRIILGGEAKELGLIDEIGGLNQAAKLALKLANDDSEPEIILPSKKQGIMSMLGDVRESKVFFLLKSLSNPQLLSYAEY